MKKSLIFGALGALFLVASATALADDPTIKLFAPKFDVAPKIDGKLDDAAWVTASARCGKTVVDLAHDASVITAFPRVAYVGYGKDALYVAFVIVSDKELVGNEADGGAVWGEDESEIFWQTDPAGAYGHIGINAAGHFTTEMGESDWDLSTIKVAASASGILHTYEVEIPWAATGGAPKSGATWRVNFNGHQVDPDIWLTANATYGGFHNPERFMDLVFE